MNILYSDIYKDIQKHIWKEQTESDEVICWCPFCDDQKIHDHAHLYLNKKTLYWNCFSCNRGAKNIYPLLEAFGVEISYLQKIRYKLSSDILENVIITKDTQDKKGQETLYTFMQESIIIPQNSKAYEYLLGRGITPDSIVHSWRLWPKKPGYAFWFYAEKGEVLFFSGRAYEKFIKPKYYHSNVNVPVVLFKKDTFIPTPLYSGKSLLFFVEGLFDALFAPGAAIPLFSKKLAATHKEKVKRLILTNNFAPVCVLDKEEISANLKLASFLYSLTNEIYLFNLNPHKDFGENTFSSLSNKHIHKRLVQYVPYCESIISESLKQSVSSP